MNTFRHLRCLAALLALAATTSDAADLPVLPVPDWQPFAAQVRRVSEALTLAGAPLSAKERAELEKALLEKDPQKARARTQQILDAHVLVAVQVTPEMRVKAMPGPAPAVLTETGWVTFLVKVHNEAGDHRRSAGAQSSGSPAARIARGNRSRPLAGCVVGASRSAEAGTGWAAGRIPARPNLFAGCRPS